MEKWKSGFIVVVIKDSRPQAMWKNLWKTLYLWKTLSKVYLLQISTSHIFNSLWKSGKHYLIDAAEQVIIIQPKLPCGKTPPKIR
ncbi:MAG: hypothetical protein HC846_02220 [Blastocatellia bacterium]|nr:hypothetical protein [Blastocatellia bacterium]